MDTSDEEAKLVGTSPTSLAVAGISFFGTSDFKVQTSISQSLCGSIALANDSLLKI